MYIEFVIQFYCVYTIPDTVTDSVPLFIHYRSEAILSVERRVVEIFSYIAELLRPSLGCVGSSATHLVLDLQLHLAHLVLLTLHLTLKYKHNLIVTIIKRGDDMSDSCVNCHDVGDGVRRLSAVVPGPALL